MKHSHNSNDKIRQSVCNCNTQLPNNPRDIVLTFVVMFYCVIVVAAPQLTFGQHTSDSAEPNNNQNRITTDIILPTTTTQCQYKQKNRRLLTINW